MRHFHPQNRISALLPPQSTTSSTDAFVRLDEEELGRMNVALEPWQIELYQEAYEKALEEHADEQDYDPGSTWN